MAELRGLSVRHNILFLLFFSILLSACGESPGSSEEQIRAWLSAGQTAVENQDRRALLDMVSDHYHDRQGNKRADIGNQLRAIFLRQQSIQLLTRIESLELFAETAAEVTMTVGMAGTNNSRFGFRTEAKRFVLELERSDGEWQLISARWGELGDTGPGVTE